MVQKPWLSGMGQSIEFIPGRYTLSGNNELWLVRGSDGSSNAGEGWGVATNDWASLDLATLTWKTGKLPDKAGYTAELTLINGVVFVRGQNASWYVANLSAD
jgi:hypothetical protein